MTLVWVCAMRSQQNRGRTLCQTGGGISCAAGIESVPHNFGTGQEAKTGQTAWLEKTRVFASS